MRQDLPAKLITSQDESHRLLGHKKDGRLRKDLFTEENHKLGKMPNAMFDMPGHKGKKHSTNPIFRPRRMVM